jgi:hypothetical protein
MGRVPLLAILLALLSMLACARCQAEDSADCSGNVLDENGAPVAGAHIQLEEGGKVHEAETNSAGRFTLRNLSPGDYKLEVRKEGFFLLSGKELSLHAGSNDVHFTLNHVQELHEQIQVAAPSDQIDPDDTTQRTALTGQEIRDIPVPSSHVLQQSLIAMPQVVQDNQLNLHIAGARSGDTQYMLDGFEIGNPVNGALTSRFSVDATRAAEIQTGGISSAYAHSGAALLNLETTDGDDRWRFGTTDPVPGINIQEGAHLGNWYPRFAFSGPIEKGRFWFSDSVSAQHTFQVVKQQPPGANEFEEWAGDNLLRLQYNITPKQILHASFLYNRAHDTNLGLDALDPQSTTVTAEQRRTFGSLKDQIWLGGTLLELGVAGDGSVLEYIPQGSQPFVLLTNGTAGNYFQHLHQHGSRVQAVGNLIAASRHWHGSHQFVAGFNVAGVNYSQFALRGEIQALRADGTLARQSTFTGPASLSLSNTQIGGYLQDNWSISKYFVLQAGIRTDRDRFTHSAMAEPRISGNALPFGNDRAKFSLGWGIYNAPLNLSLIAQALDQQQIDTFYDPTGKLVVLGPVTSQFALPANGLQQPRFTIANATWQERFGKSTLVSLELLARNGLHQFAFVDQQPSLPGGIFLLQDNRKDRYRSATFSARHTFSSNTEVYGAYTRSRAHTNEVLNPALGSIFYAPQQPGPLAWDAPNRLLTWGWAPTHIWSTQLTYFFEYRTGYPFSAVNLQQQLVGLPNSLRFPTYANLNLGIEKKFGFYGYLWAARIEVVNILGRQNPDTVVNNVDATNFGAFFGGQGRATTLRVRFVGKK